MKIAEVMEQVRRSSGNVLDMLELKQKLDGMGISFYRYVTQQRLVAAKRYMLEGRSLAQTAEEAGFCDYSAFYRAFRQEYGFSPREFRDFQHSSNINLP